MSDRIERILDALRRKMLEAAVRGELVPQHPEDEPASILLERIAAEKEKLIREGKIKKPKSASHIFRRDGHFYESINGGNPICIDDQIPFEIPDSWAWVRGKSLFEATQNKAPDTDFSYIDIDAIDNKHHVIKGVKMTKAKEAPSRARRLLQSGDILFSLVRPYLENIAMVESQYANAIASTGFYVIRTKAYVPRFAYALFLSPYVIQGLNSYMRGDNSPSIRGENMEDYLYPVPPLAEQQRIVNTLKARSERLDAIGQSRIRYKRILSETPTSLRQQLIQAAIQGRLVPQNPDDEPACVLLESIVQERERLIKEKKIKKPKSASRIYRRDGHFYESVNGGEPVCIDDQIPFEIPDSWEWCRLQDYCVYGESPSIRVKDCPSDTWVLDLEDIEAHSGRVRQRVSASDRPSTSNKYSFAAGSVLYGKLRPYLNKVVVAEEDGCCTTEIIPIKIFAETSPYYLQFLLMSSYFVSEINNDSYGVKMPRADAKKVKSFLIPVPPLAEQRRICDKLEKLLNTLKG